MQKFYSINEIECLLNVKSTFRKKVYSGEIESHLMPRKITEKGLVKKVHMISPDVFQKLEKKYGKREKPLTNEERSAKFNYYDKHKKASPKKKNMYEKERDKQREKEKEVYSAKKISFEEDLKNIQNEINQKNDFKRKEKLNNIMHYLKDNTVTKMNSIPNNDINHNNESVKLEVPEVLLKLKQYKGINSLLQVEMYLIGLNTKIHALESLVKNLERVAKDYRYKVKTDDDFSQILNMVKSYIPEEYHSVLENMNELNTKSNLLEDLINLLKYTILSRYQFLLTTYTSNINVFRRELVKQNISISDYTF